MIKRLVLCESARKRGLVAVIPNSKIFISSQCRVLLLFLQLFSNTDTQNDWNKKRKIFVFQYVVTKCSVWKLVKFKTNQTKNGNYLWGCAGRISSYLRKSIQRPKFNVLKLVF